jgi:hypothetical protein
MAEKTALPQSLYAFGEGEESTQANQRYQDAYNQLIAAVEKRSRPQFFDPTLLAISQAFLGPTKTGGFGEAAGIAAGNVAKAQETQQTREEELARMRLELAGMGVGQANQRAAVQMYREGAQTPAALPATPPGSPSGTPSGAPPEQPAPQSPSDFALQAMGIDEQGVQVFPAQPLVPKKQFLAAQAFKGVNPMDANIAYQDYLRKDIEVAQNGNVIQKSTGKIFDLPDSTPVEVPFLTLGGEKFTISKTQARKLDQAVMSGDQEKRIALENKYRGVAPSPAQMVAQAPAAPLGQEVSTAPVPPQRVIAGQPSTAAPAVAPSVAPAPSGMKSPAQLAREKAETEQKMAIAQAIAIEEGKAKVAAGVGAEGKRQETMGGERGKLAIAEEQKFAMNAENAGKLFTAADTVVNSVRKSPDYFGVFNKPGILNAIGATLSEVGKPGGKFTIVDVEQKVLQSMPGTTKENLRDRELAASALAEIELGYTQNYLAKQGAVTEGERKIVRAIPGGLSSSPKFLEIKSKLIRERAQYDMDLNTAYTEYLRAKPNGDAIDFKRNSPLYKEIHGAFERKTAELAETIPALPTKERKPAPQGNQAIDYAESLRKRMQQ